MKKQQESLKNMVYQAILNGIFTDEYKPNQIINEQELVQKFGCSKTPIREALVTLCNEGILRSFPRFGYHPAVCRSILFYFQARYCRGLMLQQLSES